MAHRQLRILRLAPHFFREGSWPVAYDPVGGMQNQVWQMVRDLDAAGMQQTVVTTHIPGSERAYPLFERSRLQAVGPSLPPFLATHLLGFTWFWALVPYLLRHLRGFDLVHLHLDHSIWCRILALALKLGPVPVVISLNVSLLSDGDAQARPAPTGLRLRLERWALCLADRVVALSPHQAKMMNLLAPKHGDRVWIVPDAIDPVAFRSGIDDETVRRFRLQHKIPEHGPIAAYIGRISEEKGWRDLPAIVQALSRNGVFVLICGDGPCRGRLERELRARCVDSAWGVTGFVPRSDVKAALRIADVIVLPSRREAFGSILLEAMSWEVPAIAYRVGGIPDVAGEPNAFALVPPQAPDRLAERALALIADRALHRSLVERGTQRVKDFSTIAARDRLLQLYDGVEGPGPQRREAPAWP